MAERNVDVCVPEINAHGQSERGVKSWSRPYDQGDETTS